MQNLWDWAKVDTIDGVEYLFTLLDHCAQFEKEFGIESGKKMRRKHRPTFQDHAKYIQNNIVRSFRSGILQYDERIREMYNMAKYLHLPSMKGGDYNDSYWSLSDT